MIRKGLIEMFHMFDKHLSLHFLTFSTSQVSPSSKPSWVLAEQAVMVHLRFPRFSTFKLFRILIQWKLLNLAEVLEQGLAY